MIGRNGNNTTDLGQSQIKINSFYFIVKQGAAYHKHTRPGKSSIAHNITVVKVDKIMNLTPGLWQSVLANVDFSLFALGFFNG